jgi:hypothetical protein
MNADGWRICASCQGAVSRQLRPIFAQKQIDPVDGNHA